MTVPDVTVNLCAHLWHFHIFLRRRLDRRMCASYTLSWSHFGQRIPFGQRLFTKYCSALSSSGCSFITSYMERMGYKKDNRTWPRANAVFHL